MFARGSSFRRTTVKKAKSKDPVDEDEDQENFIADENEEGPV